MRCSNIQVSFKIPVPINKPDGNGTVYTKEAVERAVLGSRQRLPIKTIKEADSAVIGMTNKLWFSNHNGEYYIEGTGRIWNGGTEEIVDVKDDKVLSMQIVGIGIPDK